jgi:hypothetical protein
MYAAIMQDQEQNKFQTSSEQGAEGLAKNPVEEALEEAATIEKLFNAA